MKRIPQDTSTARLLVSSGNGPGECRQAVGHALAALRTEAQTLGVEIDIFKRSAEHGPRSAIVILSGRGAARIAHAWEGAILWKCQSTLRPRHKRKNWFIQIFRLDAPAPDLRIAPSEVEMQAIRAGGPGGQHQNKTASAIRARWRSPEGQDYTVVVRDERSQHRNRSIAIARLAALVDADRAEADASRKGEARHLHHQLERGNPKRIFEGPGFAE
jgi:peptide chain release factor